MIDAFGFDTEDQSAATAALLVYAVYRSRDVRRFKVSPEMWGMIERAVKASAKRAETLPRFVESLKPRLSCATISPRWMHVGMSGAHSVVMLAGGALFEPGDDPDAPAPREFLARVFAEADDRAVLDRLYRETAYVVLLVRDRIERERPAEKRLAEFVDTEAV